SNHEAKIVILLFLEKINQIRAELSRNPNSIALQEELKENLYKASEYAESVKYYPHIEALLSLFDLENSAQKSIPLNTIQSRQKIQMDQLIDLLFKFSSSIPTYEPLSPKKLNQLFLSTFAFRT